MAAAFHTASLLSIIEQGQKMESLFVRVLLEAAVKLSTITDANIFVMVETGHGRKWAGRRTLKDEFLQGKLKNKSDDEEVFFEDEESPATPIIIPQPPSPLASEADDAVAFDPSGRASSTTPSGAEEGGGDDEAVPDDSPGVDTSSMDASPADSNAHLLHQSASNPLPHSSPSSNIDASASLPLMTSSLSPIAPPPPPHYSSPHVPNVLSASGIAPPPPPGFSPLPSPLALTDRTNVTKSEGGAFGSCSSSGGATFGAGGAVILPGGAVLPRLQHMGEISSSVKSQKPKKRKNQEPSQQHQQPSHNDPPPSQHHQHHHHALQQQQHHQQNSPFSSFPQFVPTIVQSTSSEGPHSSFSADPHHGNSPFKDFIIKPIGELAHDEATHLLQQQQRLQHFDHISALNNSCGGDSAVPPPPPPPLTPGHLRPLVGSQKRKGRPTVGHLLHQKEKMMRTNEMTPTMDGHHHHQQQQQQHHHLFGHDEDLKQEGAIAANDSGIVPDESLSLPSRVMEMEMSGGEASPLNSPHKKSLMKLIPIRPKTKSKIQLTFQDENQIETNAFPAGREGAASGIGNNNDGASGESSMALELFDPNPLVINESAAAASSTPETPRRRGVGVTGPPFFCEICNHEFSKPHHLSRHKKEQHTNVQGHPCMFCQHKFKRKEHLRRHVLSRHRTEIPDSEEAQKLFEAPPPSAAQAAAAAAAAAAYSNFSNVVDANGMLLLPPPPHSMASSMTPHSMALIPPTLAFLPPLSPATNMAPPRMQRMDGGEPDYDDAGVGAQRTTSTPSEGPFENEDGDAYFVEAEGMTVNADEEEGILRGGSSSRNHHEDSGHVVDDDDEDEEVRLVDDEDDDDDEKRKENVSVNGREVRAKFFVTNRVPSSDLIKN